jgi:uncharacterized protein YndB with AHSA1/START domain
MTATNAPRPDPSLDLVLERTVDVPRELVWRAWTTPEHLKRWFTPAPWTTVDCEIDLRPGGIFRTVMRSPEGEEFPHVGCYLEIVENERLVWTNLLEPGFRPAPSSTAQGAPYFTAVISLASHGAGTRYTAVAMHQDENARRNHEQMGFHQGWSAALDQLVGAMSRRT